MSSEGIYAMAMGQRCNSMPCTRSVTELCFRAKAPCCQFVCVCTSVCYMLVLTYQGGCAVCCDANRAALCMCVHFCLI